VSNERSSQPVNRTNRQALSQVNCYAGSRPPRTVLPSDVRVAQRLAVEMSCHGGCGPHRTLPSPTGLRPPLAVIRSCTAWTGSSFFSRFIVLNSDLPRSRNDSLAVPLSVRRPRPVESHPLTDRTMHPPKSENQRKVNLSSTSSLFSTSSVSLPSASSFSDAILPTSVSPEHNRKLGTPHGGAHAKSSDRCSRSCPLPVVPLGAIADRSFHWSFRSLRSSKIRITCGRLHHQQVAVARFGVGTWVVFSS